MTNPVTDNVPVVQADRDAAYRYWQLGEGVANDAGDGPFTSGDMDGTPLVQSYARHRLASEAGALEKLEAQIVARVDEHPEPRNDEEQEYVWGLEYALTLIRVRAAAKEAHSHAG